MHNDYYMGKQDEGGKYSKFFSAVVLALATVIIVIYLSSCSTVKISTNVAVPNDTTTSRK